MGNEMFQARLNDDFAEKIHEYREDNFMNKSEAVRHLLRVGLEAEADDQADELEQSVQEATTEAEGNATGSAGIVEAVASTGSVILSAGMLLTSVLVMVSGVTYPSFALPAIVLSTALMVAAMITVWLALLAQLALARPLRGLVGLGTYGVSRIGGGGRD